MATTMARPAAEAIKKRAEKDGIEFFFAQFVDMNAQAVGEARADVELRRPASTEGAGFAGFAAGPIGQTPASPDMMAIPDLRSYTRVPFKSEPGPLRLRHLRRGQGVAVLPAHDPAHASSSGRRASATRSRSAWSSSSSCCARRPTAASSWPTRSTGSTSPATT